MFSRPAPIPPPLAYQPTAVVSSAVQNATTKELKEVEVNVSRECAGCHRPGAKWRRVTRDYLCESCRGQPPHQLITRSRAQNEYGLSFEQLHEAFRQKRVRMFTVRNPHQTCHKACAPCRLYYVHEIEQLAEELGT